MARAYRKKPVVIEAVQWTGENHAEMCEFIDPEVFEIIPRVGLVIHTLEGDHHASPGDYIIKGVNGEFYPCKPDIFAKTYESATLTPPNEPLTCGLVDRHGMPLRAGDTVTADKFFVYAVRYGSHNVNPDNCAPAYQVGWYLEIMWAYPGFEDSVGHTEPLYDIDGTAARYPAHRDDTADGLYNLKLEVCCRPPEGEEKTR